MLRSLQARRAALGGDAQQEYFSAGLTDGMTGELGRLLPQRLAVTARTSVARYKGTNKTAKEIGQELGVGYLLSASVRRNGPLLHIQAHLTRTSDETEIWTDSHQREVGGVFALQTEMALAVARTIRLKLGARQLSAVARQRKVKPAAYEAYRRGQVLGGGDLQVHEPRSPELRARAKAVVLHALELDGELAEAHVCWLPCT